MQNLLGLKNDYEIRPKLKNNLFLYFNGSIETKARTHNIGFGNSRTLSASATNSLSASVSARR